MAAWPSIARLATDVQAGAVSVRSLVEQALQTITEQSDFEAIIATLEVAALERADILDKRRAGGENIGRLAGVPFIA